MEKDKRNSLDSGKSDSKALNSINPQENYFRIIEQLCDISLKICNIYKSQQTLNIDNDIVDGIIADVLSFKELIGFDSETGKRLVTDDRFDKFKTWFAKVYNKHKNTIVMGIYIQSSTGQSINGGWLDSSDSVFYFGNNESKAPTKIKINEIYKLARKIADKEAEKIMLYPQQKRQEIVAKSEFIKIREFYILNLINLFSFTTSVQEESQHLNGIYSSFLRPQKTPQEEMEEMAAQLPMFAKAIFGALSSSFIPNDDEEQKREVEKTIDSIFQNKNLMGAVTGAISQPGSTNPQDIARNISQVMVQHNIAGEIQKMKSISVQEKTEDDTVPSLISISTKEKLVESDDEFNPFDAI